MGLPVLRLLVRAVPGVLGRVLGLGVRAVALGRRVGSLVARGMERLVEVRRLVERARALVVQARLGLAAQGLRVELELQGLRVRAELAARGPLVRARGELARLGLRVPVA
ncbi:hypothetical protein [Kribbella sp. NPDC051770]|uniref:hypothetical protein n=1 Tax=Kribbella sp. NPDC051770 TaxID=3155413 RepID=UPI003447A619